MLKLQAIPFVPGLARGIVHNGIAGASGDSIVVATTDQIRALEFLVKGAIIIDGAPFSHPMIRLLSLGVPTVIILPEQVGRLSSGLEVIVDGASGLITNVPPEGEMRARPEVPPPPHVGTPVTTADAVEVELRASVSDLAGVSNAIRCGATSIGLLRSEYLQPPEGHQPDAAFYEEALSAICEAAHPLRFNVRLPDFTGNKRPPWLPAIPGMENPLGLRGVRLYDIEPVRSVIRAEVEVLGKLASRHDLSLLLPYIGQPQEFIYWRNQIESFLPVPMAVGVMVETPAATLAIREWLELTDLVAIGCNDLMQCLFAVDRNLSRLSHLLDPYAPALFRLFQRIAEDAGDAVGNLQLCGLLPRLPGVLPVLLGLGYRTFSVEPVLIPFLARTVQDTDTRVAEGLATGVCTAFDGSSVRALLGLPTISV